MMARANKEDVRRWISLYITGLRRVTTSLNGSDLLELGVPPGPQVREFLDELRRRTLDEEIVGREAEINWVRERLGGG